MPKFSEAPIPESREGELKPETKVILHFFRHEEKENPKPGQSEEEVELTQRGKAKASQRGREKSPKGAPLAFGSPRIRTADTAQRRAYAGYLELSPDLSYEEGKKLVNQELRYGTRVAILPELNFNYTRGEYNDRFKKEFKDGHLLDFMLKDSDALVRELNDQESLSYSRVAANFASLVAREMQVGNNFNRLVGKKPEQYQDYGNKLERFFGTHANTPECFYLKILEKVYGKDKAVEFVETFRDSEGKANGFDFQEGFKVEITNNADGQKIILQGIRGFEDIELTPELLKEIISDAINLDAEIRKSDK